MTLATIAFSAHPLHFHENHAGQSNIPRTHLHTTLVKANPMRVCIRRAALLGRSHRPPASFQFIVSPWGFTGHGTTWASSQPRPDRT